MADRYTAGFRFDAKDTEDVRRFARLIRSHGRRNLSDWDAHDARLLRVKDVADGRGGADIRFNADTFGEARDWARALRKALRGSRRASRYSYRSTVITGLQDYKSRNTVLLKVKEPKVATEPVAADPVAGEDEA